MINVSVHLLIPPYGMRYSLIPVRFDADGKIGFTIPELIKWQFNQLLHSKTD